MGTENEIGLTGFTSASWRLAQDGTGEKDSLQLVFAVPNALLYNFVLWEMRWDWHQTGLVEEL